MKYLEREEVAELLLLRDKIGNVTAQTERDIETAGTPGRMEELRTQQQELESERITIVNTNVNTLMILCTCPKPLPALK